MRFVYPVTPKNGNDDKLFYLKGASNRTGYYPIGRMNTWHGGIHYEGDNAINAISDGNIIAYRVCSDIDKDGKKRSFSNSFVLIQHQYESPNKQKLCFYSLYNHLSFFQEMIGNKIPAIFKVNAYSVKDTAKDTKEVKGAKIKDASGNLLAIAPMGTKLKFLADDKDKDRRKVEYKTPKGKSIVGDTYVAKFNTVQIVDATSGEVLAESFKGNDGDNEYGANLYKEAKNSSEIKQLIVRGSSIEIAKEDRGKTGWLKVTKVGDEKVSGYCNSGALKKVDVFTLTNDQLDTVVNPCIEVKAGDIIGFTGKNGFEKQEAYRGVHVEVFTPDDVTNFLSNVNKDGDKNKNFTKLTEGTELKKKYPLQVIKNTPVKKTGKTTDAYTEIELDNLEVIVDNKKTELPECLGGFYIFKDSGSSKLANTSALANFNKIVGDIAKMGDQVKLEKELDGDQRRVSYINVNKGFTFWVKSEDIEEKILSFTIKQASVAKAPSQTTNTSNVAVLAPPAPKSTVETKKYNRLNKEISEVYLIAPDEKNVNTKIVADVIVNIKEGKIYKDKDKKEWYFLEPIGVQKNGVAIKYKGLVCKDDLEENFSPYDWTKFGFELKEDTANNYIYSLGKKTSFFSDICKIVDEDGDGILEPYELQRALSNHYTADKLSHLVCKHFNEWAYGSKYIAGLVDEYDNFYKEAVKKDAKGKALANQQELDEIKQERLDALKAKVSDLEIWEGIEVRKSSYRTKFVNGALMSSPIIMGEYLIYKLGKWVYERMAYGDKKEEEIPLSPFPIANPVVSHFHPVAFVEQMRRIFLKEDIDLRKRDKWQTQFDSKFGNKDKQNVACWRSCMIVLANHNVNGGNLVNGTARFQIATESNNKLVVDENIAKKSIEYIDEQLEADKPILVGVDHTYKYKGGFNNDLTTDHFIVLAGRSSDTQGSYYLFYEVGTSFERYGISNENKLYIQSDNSLRGSTAYTSKHKYTVTQVRKNN